MRLGGVWRSQVHFGGVARAGGDGGSAQGAALPGPAAAAEGAPHGGGRQGPHHQAARPHQPPVAQGQGKGLAGPQPQRQLQADPQQGQGESRQQGWLQLRWLAQQGQADRRRRCQQPGRAEQQHHHRRGPEGFHQAAVQPQEPVLAPALPQGREVGIHPQVGRIQAEQVAQAVAAPLDPAGEGQILHHLPRQGPVAADRRVGRAPEEHERSGREGRGIRRIVGGLDRKAQAEQAGHDRLHHPLRQAAAAEPGGQAEQIRPLVHRLAQGPLQGGGLQAHIGVHEQQDRMEGLAVAEVAVGGRATADARLQQQGTRGVKLVG